RLALDDDRNLNLDLLATLDGEQVNVVDVQGQHVLVQVLDHGQVLFALDVDLDDGVDAVVTDDGGEVQQVHGDVDRIGLRTVDHGRDLPVATQTTGGTLTEFGTRGGLEGGVLCSHVVLLKVVVDQKRSVSSAAFIVCP